MNRTITEECILESEQAAAPVARERFYERLGMAAAIAAFAIVLGLFSGPLFAGKIYSSIDVFASYYPTLHFYHRCLQNGDSFLWMPQVFGGCYLHGIGQAAMTHPLQLALYSLLPWPWPFALIYPLSYPFMLCGMYVFLRREGLDRVSSLFGGLVMALSGFAMLHWMHMSAVGIIAHTPWLLVMLQELARRPSPGRSALAAVGISVLTASQALLGYPQFVYFSCVAEGVYILFALRQNFSFRLPAVIFMAKVLGIILASVQLLPTWDMLTHSVRAIPGADFRVTYSLPPYMLLQLLGPNLFDRSALGDTAHEYGVYCGVTTVLLSAWAIVRYRQLGSARAWVFALAALGIVLALGKYGGLYSLLSHLPLLSKFRCPARHIAVIHLALSVLAALAFMDLARTRNPNALRRPLATVAIALIVAWLIPVLALTLSAMQGPWTPWIENIPFSSPARMFVGPILATMACALIFAAARGYRFALPLLIVFAAVDQGWFGLRYVRFGPVFDPVELVEKFPKPPRTERNVSAVGSSMNMMLTMAGYSTVDGYMALKPKRQLDYSTPAVRRVAGVRWIYVTPPRDARSTFSTDPSWKDIGPVLPRARLVSNAEVCADPNARLPEIDPETMALVEEPISLDQGNSGTAVIIEDRPGNIMVRTKAPGRQLLVLTESYYDGWQARIDGVPAPILPAYGDFIGCPVPAGDHEIQLTFRPKSMVWGLRATIAGVIGTLLMGLALWLAPRRNANSDTERNG